jgi:hypothetical protein
VEPPATWSPRPVEIAAAAACGVLALLLAVVADPMGQLLFAVAAIGLLLLAAADLLLWPRLAADPTGLQVRTLTTHRRLPWSSIDRVDVDEHARRGLVSRTLEIESDGELIVLSKRVLGEDPRDVLATLARIRYRTP